MAYNYSGGRSLRRRLKDSGLPMSFGGKCQVALGVAAGAWLACAPGAKALSLYEGTVGGQSLEINLDTTIEYSNIFRVNSPSKVLTSASNINANDGDLNLQHGLVDNTIDALPVFDLKYGNYGLHVSGEAFLDTPYLGRTQNDDALTYNPYTTDSRHYTSATRNVNGQNAILLDAFVYGTRYFGPGGEQSFTLKVGRQTLLWGQSLYFANNGIAAGQAPIDSIKAYNLPNAQAQQIFLPVGQVVASYALSPNLNFQAYYQFEWEPDTIEGVGSYFSTTDLLDKGGQRLIGVEASPGYAGYNFYRTKDLRPPVDNGQFGAAVQGTLGAYDLGLYALRFDEKAPEGVYLGPPAPGGGPGNNGSYWLVYPRDVQVYGASFSTVLNSGPNIAGEISGRRNMPLVTQAAPFVNSGRGSANTDALYPVGNTVAAQLSEVYVSPGIPLDPGGITTSGEVEVNHLVSVDKNRDLLEEGRNGTAAAFEFVVEPTYQNVLPNLEVQFPIGLEYNVLGRSEVDSTMNHGTGFWNCGVALTYRTNWTANLTYQSWFGKADPTLNPLADRGYVAFSVQHTF